MTTVRRFFRFEVGLFVRRRVLRIFQQMVCEEGVTVCLADDGGWWSRVYYVTVSGDRAANLEQRFMYWMLQVTGREGGDP